MSDELMKILEGLRKDYLAKLPAKIEAIEQHHAKRETTELVREFHKLKGTGKTYGLPEISEVCLLAEKLCAEAKIQDEVVGLALTLLRQILKIRLEGKEFLTATSPEFKRLDELKSQSTAA